ncbi:hypothetical protein D3C87_1347180 [compost metagenome]
MRCTERGDGGLQLIEDKLVLGEEGWVVFGRRYRERPDKVIPLLDEVEQLSCPFLGLIINGGRECCILIMRQLLLELVLHPVFIKLLDLVVESLKLRAEHRKLVSVGLDGLKLDDRRLQVGRLDANALPNGTK